MSLEPARIRRCANRCDFCFVDGLPDGPARRALHPGRRLPALLPLRQLRHADQPQAEGRRADHRVPALAALRLGARHRPHRPPLSAAQSHRARDHPAAARVRGPRDRVPHPDRDVARGERRARCCGRRSRELYEFGPAIIGCSVVPVGLTEFSKHHLVREPTAEECRAAIALVDERAADRAGRAGHPLGLRRGRAVRARGRRAAAGRDLRRLRSGRERGGRGALAAARGSRAARSELQGWAGTPHRRRHRHRDGPAHADGARAAGPGHGRHVRADPGREHALRPVGHDRRTAPGHRAAAGAAAAGAISTSCCCPASR